MKLSLLNRVITLAFLICASSSAFAQTKLKGKVTDETSGEALLGATIIVDATSSGTVTDFDGFFELKAKANPPFTITVSYIGYEDKQIEVTSDETLNIQLSDGATTIDVVTVKGQRISDKQKAAPLTVESLDVLAIKEAAADNFYDQLGSLKGVDLTAASLGFKVINTRGFNSTSPVRSLQIIDGVDNQSPGLNFSLGNFLGAPELDVRKVDIIQGASSAFYGPNAFNGVIAMETKNPFYTEGLSAQIKLGERNMVNPELRWAQSFKNKDGLKSVAYKVTLSYLRADDWVADNDNAVDGTDTRKGNPGGWDRVNTYGDEYHHSGDRRSFIEPISDVMLSGSQTGMSFITHRPGYAEQDLVDYDTRNFKALASVYIRTNPKAEDLSPELILAGSYGAGTTVYQGDNRFSLKNITFFQPRIEFRKRDDYFIRAYMSTEDAGNSYDPYFTALSLQERALTPGSFHTRFGTAWINNNYDNMIEEMGYPGNADPEAAAKWMEENADILTQYHQEVADQVNAPNPSLDLSGRLVPGTPEFEAAFNEITSALNNSEENGTRFYDKSDLYHLHGEKKFNPTFAEITVGANARLYTPDSKGTVFYDTADIKIRNFEYGFYAGINKVIQDGKWRFSATARVDKGQNFNYIATPAASIVWKPRPNHFARISFSSGVRNPTLSDQYLYLNVGPAILAGNLEGVDSLVTVESLIDYLGSSILDRDKIEYFSIDAIRPERVKTFEVGYRATLLDNVYVDAGYYFNIYNDFIGYNIGVETSFEPPTGDPLNPADPFPIDPQVFRYASNAKETVTTQGFSIGMNYYFAKYFQANGNYSFNALVAEADDPIVPAFNTPKHKFNVGVSGRNVTIGRLKNIGFNVNYKWIEGFLFEGSPQFTGFVPSYGLLNGQINYQFPKANMTVKLGASNILNNLVFQTYGGPRIGRLAYVSFLYDFKTKK